MLENDLRSQLELTGADFTRVALDLTEGLEGLSTDGVSEIRDRVLVGRGRIRDPVQVLIGSGDHAHVLVQHVEHFADELKLHAMRDVEELGKAKIAVIDAWHPETVAADQVATLSGQEGGELGFGHAVALSDVDDVVVGVDEYGR